MTFDREAWQLIITHRARADAFAYAATHFNFTLPEYSIVCNHWVDLSKKTADVIERLINEISNRQKGIEIGVDDGLYSEARNVVDWHRSNVETTDFMIKITDYSEVGEDFTEAKENHVRLHMKSATFIQHLIDELTELRDQTE